MTEGNDQEVSLSEIMAEPETGAATSQEQGREPAQAGTEGQQRDEHGRFAAKAEAEAVKQEVQQEQPPEPEQGKGGTVPQQALHAARQAEREANSQVADLTRQLSERDRQMQEMQGQINLLMQHRQQPQQPEKPKEQPKPFWEEPDSFVQRQVAEAVTPLQQALNQQRMGMSRLMAEDKLGAEVVTAAEKALADAMKAGRNDPALRAEVTKIVRAPHPYSALVGWHKQQQARQRVGDDPDAWLEAEIAKRIADPTFQAKVIETARGSAGNGNSQRSEPVTQLPPSLTRLPGGGNAPAEVDMSDAGLFRHATGG